MTIWPIISYALNVHDVLHREKGFIYAFVKCISWNDQRKEENFYCEGQI